MAFSDDIERALAAASWPSADAAKRGRWEVRPYVPVLRFPKHTSQLKGRAFETRSEAIGYAQSYIDKLKENTRQRLAEPRNRALRQHYGLPSTIPQEPR